MTAWIDLPGARSTVNSVEFGALVDAIAGSQDGLDRAFADRAVGMQHLACVGVEALTLAPALQSAFASGRHANLFGERNRRRRFGRLERRVDTLVRDPEVAWTVDRQ